LLTRNTEKISVRAIIRFIPKVENLCLRTLAPNRMSAPIDRQVGLGGKTIFQNCGAGDRNSTGNERSLLVHLPADVQHSLPRALVFLIFEGELSALGDASGRIIMAPLALTV